MEREWELLAICRNADPEVFFSDRKKKLARAICGRCPVSDDCLASTLKREQGLARAARVGIAAGLSGEQRWDLERARQKKADEQKADSA
ncbi:WhiB family transcriptional regulator [Streptomyces murinus]|uniref:WhiB family transcriptional regulator n=1 Tax=Streptomyces murinus TaxID=33900 RepID=UPI002E11B1B5|nr:WhiB family transcriptional regulator [Streptomyces murinus]